MSIIYKIFCKDENIKDSYVGSTNYYDKRKNQHKSNCNNINSIGYNCKLYIFIRANGGFENFDFIILEQFENKMIRQDLLKIEGSYIKNNNATLNCRLPGRTKKEWIEINKKKIQKYHKDYREDNREKLKKYYIETKTKKQEYNKVKYEENKEQLSEKRKEKVICEFCKSLIRKSDITKHRKTKKCIEIQNKKNN